MERESEIVGKKDDLCRRAGRTVAKLDDRPCHFKLGSTTQLDSQHERLFLSSGSSNYIEYVDSLSGGWTWRMVLSTINSDSCTKLNGLLFIDVCHSADQA